jgi:AcrR family transcriptional regulator
MARPKKQDTENTKARALDAADTLLHQYGYLGVSMDAVAAAIGIRKASLYHHFPGGKDELMLTIAERLIEFDATGFQRSIESHQSARDQLEAMATFIFSDRRQTDRVLRDAMRFMPEEHQKSISEGFFQHLFSKVHATFERGVNRGEFRPHDTELSTWAFLGLVSELNGERDAARPDLASRVVGMLIDGLHA